MDTNLRPCLVAIVLLGMWAALLGTAADMQEERLRVTAEPDVRAAAFGYQADDATAALQAAIRSGAARVMVENLGTPWVVGPIELASDQEIVLEQGVVVQARRGAFKGRGDCLFSASLKTNITLTGPGATLRMWKQDYDDPNQYPHAEWRHALSFKSCAGVRVTGLTLADSGGDGIYLGVARKGVPCSDVVIRDVVCDNHYRQGISVISARNLLIENVVLRNTGGTAPMAGIDFEPNHASEELVNCVMRNCVSENNRGSAYTFYLRPLNAASRPVSIRLENCRAVGGRNSLGFYSASDSPEAAVQGSVDFINCTFEGGRDGGVLIGDKPSQGVGMRFVQCRIINAATNAPAVAPIQLVNRSRATEDLGNIHFEACVITDPLNRAPISYRDQGGGTTLGEITGTLIVNGQTFALTREQMARWIPVQGFKRLPTFDLRQARFAPVLPGSLPAGGRPCTARVRGASQWLLWAEAGQPVTFTVTIRRVGKGEPSPVPVSVVSPSGKSVKLRDAQGEGETAYEWVAVETGAHRIVCDARQWTATVNSPRQRVSLLAADGRLHLLGTTGEYYFWVPPGTREFGLVISGDGDAERVKAALRDPNGKLVAEQDSIADARQFLARPLKEQEGEIWSVRLDRPSTGVLEDFYLRFQGIPPVVSHSKEFLLKTIVP